MDNTFSYLTLLLESGIYPYKKRGWLPQAYLIKVNNDIPLNSLAAFNVLQGQGEVDPAGVRDIKVVCVILIPFLNGSKHLIFISADNVHVLLRKIKGLLPLDLYISLPFGTQSNYNDLCHRWGRTMSYG